MSVLLNQNFRGPNCELALAANENRCLSNPCWNGGTCSVQGSNTVCACSNPFIGATCKERASCNNNNPCKNGGTCLYFFGQFGKLNEFKNFINFKIILRDPLLL